LAVERGPRALSVGNGKAENFGLTAKVDRRGENARTVRTRSHEI